MTLLWIYNDNNNLDNGNDIIVGIEYHGLYYDSWSALWPGIYVVRLHHMFRASDRLSYRMKGQSLSIEFGIRYTQRMIPVE